MAGYAILPLQHIIFGAVPNLCSCVPGLSPKPHMLENFFFYGASPVDAEKGRYAPLLVMASYIVASFGSYAGLTLAIRLFSSSTQRQRHLLYAMGSFALGGGIWSMHF